MDIKQINVLVLAYLGDTIYEDYIREYLINSGIANVNDLQKSSLNYVSAISQANFIKKLIDEEIFTEEEMNVIKRARNNSSKSHPKSCDVITYRYATALEAVIGYLKLKKDNNRIETIMNKILGE